MTTNTLTDLAGALYHQARQLKRRLLRKSEGEAILRDRYQTIHGKPLTDQPRTFTEKLYHRMLEWHRAIDPKYPWLTDKYSVRAYVESELGPEYLPDLLWHGSRPVEIPEGLLHLPCIIKPTHASQRVLVNRNTIGRERVEAVCRAWLQTNYYWHGREAQYYPLTPAIQIEGLLEDESGNLPLDYKVWCFHGEPELIQVIDHSKTFNSFFDVKWNLLNIRNHATRMPKEMPKPDNLHDMLSVAERLSREFDFVRVDLYTVRGRVYFGELTFTPTAGVMKFEQPEWDQRLGEKW